MNENAGRITTLENPDVLECLANLSNDEVFTPPKVANKLLDLLPADIWKDKRAKFLDPASKTGVFLREISKRLIVGLEESIPKLQIRINHICRNQLYGIGVTELTGFISRRSVYCSKTANGKKSICNSFKDEEGNIIFRRIEHFWNSGKCKYCGVKREGKYDRDGDLENHAYQFIHMENPEDIFKMKFDVIIGNPPYQLGDGGHGASASPLYHKFVEQAKKLNPRYLIMIIPSRWFVGGKGLDEFRAEMLNDTRIRKLHDYIDASNIFPGVDIKGGVCYFLWDRDNKGLCEYHLHDVADKDMSIGRVSIRPLKTKGCDTVIRYEECISILEKTQKNKRVRHLLN